MANSADETAKKLPGKPFKAGEDWNGNRQGRPKGARNKLSEDFLKALSDDFDKNGVAAISAVRADDPAKYLSIIAQVIPRDVNVELSGTEAFLRVWELVAAGAFTSISDNVSRAEERPN